MRKRIESQRPFQLKKKKQLFAIALQNFATLETRKTKNFFARTIWQHVILSMQSKWFQVKAIYFYGPLLLKYPRKSRSKWDRMGKSHQGGNMRKLRSHFQQAGLYPTCFRLVLPYIKELWGKCVGNEICTIRTLVAKSFTLDIGAMYISFEQKHLFGFILLAGCVPQF